MMRGVIMAAGKGSRLWPLTAVTNKHLLPVFDKPMIFYPLTTLILAGATDILLICNARDLDEYRDLLGDGSRFGIHLRIAIQNEAKGIAEAFTLQPEFFRNSPNNVLILGDNLLYGSGLGISLHGMKDIEGAMIFGYEVANPTNYGVVEIDSELNVLSLEEKPNRPKSKYAVPGLYFYDESVVDRARRLMPSPRGELEITDLNASYLEDGKLQVKILERGTAWLDTGSIEDLVNASEFVKVIEHRQGLKIGVPEEAAWRQGLISSELLLKNLSIYPDSNYKKYLQNLVG
jgi:glucose-1-phosphate thymidylyltransferase